MPVEEHIVKRRQEKLTITIQPETLPAKEDMEGYWNLTKSTVTMPKDFDKIYIEYDNKMSFFTVDLQGVKKSKYSAALFHDALNNCFVIDGWASVYPANMMISDEKAFLKFMHRFYVKKVGKTMLAELYYYNLTAKRWEKIADYVKQ